MTKYIFYDIMYNMNNKENKSEFVIVRVTEREKQLLLSDAKSEGLTISKLVRKLMNLD